MYRIIQVISAIQILYLFVWTSHLILELWLSVNTFPLLLFTSEIDYIFNNVSGTNAFIVIDFVALMSFIAFFVSTYKLSGMRFAIQLSALLLQILPILIFFFDRGEFYIPVTMTQINYNILPWFTNEILFIVTVIIYWSLKIPSRVLFKK